MRIAIEGCRNALGHGMSEVRRAARKSGDVTAIR